MPAIGCAGKQGRIGSKSTIVLELPGLGRRNVSRWEALHFAAGGSALQALLLMLVYIATTAVVQFVGFLISRLVDLQFPAISVLAFLLMFIAAFGVAWPIAVLITEWLIVRSGRKVEASDDRAV